jgi:ABC-type polysaccharide/polyol phosphate transport system ATPase subunit
MPISLYRHSIFQKNRMEAGRARMRQVLILENVTKEFRTYHRYHAGLKALVLNPRQIMRHRERDRFLAISEVSFAVCHGETFGILGRNGAGKSTLLALMAGVLRPTSGKISVHGRISPLLELGVGFTQELTGVENILINGVLLGLRRKEIEAKLDDIISFSGLSSFIDQPLKTYSSGMQIRLGFAIAIHVQPDILLVDEVLAVGDAEFQEKCFARITDLQRAGVTIVLVSHNLNTVETLCDRAVWIDKGCIVTLGSPQEVVARYQSEIAHLLSNQESASVSV